MGLIQNLIKGMGENKKELKLKFKEAQQEQRVQDMLSERKKSANQRELERYVKEENEREIKETLDKIHKKQNADNWKGTSILKSQTNILKDDMKILNNDRPILGQKNIFLDNKTNIPLTKKRLFQGW